MTPGAPTPSAADRFFDHFAPVRATSPAEALQLRLIVGGAMLGCLVAVPALAMSVLQSQTSAAAAIGVFGISCLALVSLVRRGTSLRTLRVSALTLVSGFLVIASLQTADLQWQQFKWLALIPMLSLFLEEPSRDRRGFKGRVGALWTGSALAIALAFLIVAANRAGWTFSISDDASRLTADITSMVDMVLFLVSVSGLLTIHDLALRRSEAELDLLRSMLAVCAWCRRIRDEDEGWVVMERYMTRHQVASLTHGICPDCEAKTMAELERGR